MTAYKCPNCTAILKVDEDKELVKCEYCGTVISIDRKPEEKSTLRARDLAEKAKEYRKKLNSVNEAREDFEKKNEALLKLMDESKDISKNVTIYSVIIWVAVFLGFCAIMSDVLYYYNVIRIFVDAVFCIGSIFVVYKTAQNIKEKKTEEIAEKQEKAQLQMNNAKKKLDELCNGFDESFIPVEARSDEAIDYIINALKTEKAYSINQAVEQWKEYYGMQEKLREANRTIANLSEENRSSSNTKSETVGAFTGAALGAFGGAVVREAVREIKKHL